MTGIKIDGTQNKVVLDDDADTYLEAATDDTIKVYVAGAQDFTITANTLTAESGSTITGPTVVGSTSIQTPLIEFTDGDNAISIADGGGVTIATSLDMNGTELILDADQDTSITADTDDRIDLRAGGTDTLHVGNGVVTVGTPTDFGPTGFASGVKVKGDVLIGDFTNDSIASTLCFIKSRNTTVGSQTIVADDDEVGSIDFRADDGDDTGYNNNVARIAAAIDAAPGTNDTAGNITFATTADGARTVTERARITSSGQFLVGATSSSRFFNIESDLNAQYALHIEHTQAAPYGIFLQYTGAAPDATNDNYAFYFSDTGTARFYIGSDGDAYNHDNAYNQISDERIKQNITDANSQWDDIKALKVRNFVFKDDARAYGDKAKVQIGVVAQEAESVCPKLVTEVKPSPADVISSSELGTLYEDGDELPVDTKVGDVKEVKDHVKGFRYSVLYMKAIKALQEAQTRIETLETSNTDLKNRVTTLEG